MPTNVSTLSSGWTKSHRNSIDAISGLQLRFRGPRLATAPAVSLGDVANVEVREGASRILRESGSRLVIVKVNLIGRDQGSFVAEAQRFGH